MILSPKQSSKSVEHQAWSIKPGVSSLEHSSQAEEIDASDCLALHSSESVTYNVITPVDSGNFVYGSCEAGECVRHRCVMLHASYSMLHS